MFIYFGQNYVFKYFMWNIFLVKRVYLTLVKMSTRKCVCGKNKNDQIKFVVKLIRSLLGSESKKRSQ